MCDKSMGFFSSCFIQSQLKTNIVTYSIDACVTTYHVRQTMETTQNTCKEIRYLLILWLYMESICYSKTWSLLHHRNYPVLEQLQRKDLKTHKGLKLLKRSGSQCKYTAEYWFKIAKQPTLNRATSAATHFQGKYTSIQIREPATTEAVMGGLLWKKLFLKVFSIFTGKNLRQSLFLINLLAWRPATL